VGAVVDAVTVIALLDPTDAHHADARTALAALAGSTKLIHPINLAEVLVKPAETGAEITTLAALVRAGFATFTPSTAEPVTLARARAATRLKMPDACAYVTAQSTALPLVTFDRKLTLAARANGLTVLGAPTDWV
jgi:predicted nucleic acid-binding protein